MSATAVSENAHYHIVWQIAGTALLDYFPFENIRDARETAEQHGILLLATGEG